MSDPIHDLLTDEGLRWRAELTADPPLATLITTSAAIAGRHGRARVALRPRVLGPVLAAVSAVVVVALWLTGAFSGTSPRPQGVYYGPGWTPPYNLAVAGAGPREHEEATVAHGIAGKPIRITVTLHYWAHPTQSGRIRRLDLIIGTATATAGAGSGPGAPSTYVGRRKNQIASAHFHPGVPVNGDQFTATFVVPRPGRYPIDGQMLVTHRSLAGQPDEIGTGQQLGYLRITSR